MNYELTIFKNQFDNKTHRKMALASWDEFVQLLYGLSKKKGEKGGRNSSPLITPAVFEEGTTRSNNSTLHWGGWCCLDVDDHDYPADINSLKEQLINEFNDYDFVCYSTAGSRSDFVKFRLIFRTDQVVERDRIKAFWYAINTHVGDIGDPQTKDLARMYYVPARYPNAYSFIFHHNGGSALNVDALLEKYPYVQKTGNSFLDRLPPEMQKAVVEHRKSQLTNTNFSWNGYRDCPFLNKRLIGEYKMISGTGWYHKSYSIMVSIATSAIRRGYPITADEIAQMCREMDNENPATRERYKRRKYETEADRAIEYAYRKN